MKSLTYLTILGILLMILGVLAIFSPAFAGEAVITMIGILLLISGLAQFIHGLRADSRREKLMPLILGGITGLCGIFLLGHPLFGLGLLTTLLLVFFISEGLWKVITSFSYRPASGWVWMFLGGILSLGLAFLIWKQWPLSGLWAVGVLIGIDLLTTGLAMTLLASSLRRLAKG